MLDAIKKMLGMGPSVDLGEVLRNGAVVVDVRTKGEYNSGHVKGSLNIPLESLQQHIEKLRKQNKTVITCCASGMRSRAAAGMLKSNGITAYNGGSWYSVDALKSRTA